MFNVLNLKMASVLHYVLANNVNVNVDQRSEMMLTQLYCCSYMLPI